MLDGVGKVHGWRAGTYGRATVHRSKSGRPRVVPVPPEAWAALQATPRSVGGTVFPLLRIEADTENVTKSSAGVLNRYLGRACKRAGIPRITPHDMRHHWATTLGIAGIPPEILRAWGGWRDLEMVARYCRMPTADVVGVADKARA